MFKVCTVFAWFALWHEYWVWLSWWVGLAAVPSHSRVVEHGRHAVTPFQFPPLGNFPLAWKRVSVTGKILPVKIGFFFGHVKNDSEEFSFGWTWKSWLYFRGYVEPGLNGGWAQGNNMKSHLVFFFVIITMPSSLALTTSQVGWLHKNLWRKNEEVRSWNRIRSCWFQLNEFTKQFVQHTQQVRGLFEDDWWDKHSFASMIMLSFA